MADASTPPSPTTPPSPHHTAAQHDHNITHHSHEEITIRAEHEDNADTKETHISRSPSPTFLAIHTTQLPPDVKETSTSTSPPPPARSPDSSTTSTQKQALSAGPALDPDAALPSDALPPNLDLSAPPPLNYTLRTRKLAITIFWTLILIDSIAIPLVLYFTLHNLTSLSPNAVFSISTGCLGGVSIVEYFLRFWRLWRHGSTVRVLGARRWYLDWFHWNFSIAWIFIMVELIVGTIPRYPPMRLLAMPVSSLLFWFAFELLAIDTLRYLHVPAPIRISSVPRGAPMRPAIYSIVEDVVAVDGSGGTEFRRRLNARYLASHYFRQMLHRLTIFWAGGGLACAVVTTALVFTLGKDAAYVVGWALPFVWTGLMIPPTFWYVNRCLRREYAKWPERRTSV